MKLSVPAACLAALVLAVPPATAATERGDGICDTTGQAWAPLRQGLCEQAYAERLSSRVPPRPADPLPCLNAERGDGTCPRWTARVDTDGYEEAIATAVDPRGQLAFVTGVVQAGSQVDFLTVAYDLASGAERWRAVHDNVGGNDWPYALAVDPGGDLVFVTGRSHIAGDDHDYLTVAYDAATGRLRWARRFDGPMPEQHRPNQFVSGDWPRDLAVSPDGATVYVTGSSQGEGTFTDFTTVAMDAAGGSVRWVARYDGPAGFLDAGWALSVAPDGRAVYVTGGSHTWGTPADGYDYATVAYDAATGRQRWDARWAGQVQATDFATDVAASPDGSKVYVTGTTWERRFLGYDYATFAYDARTGETVWSSLYNGLGNSRDTPWALAVSPDGSRVFVTGESERSREFVAHSTDRWFDYATVAYDGATGRQRWASRVNGPGDDFDAGYGLGVSPDGERLYVTGTSGTDRWIASVLNVPLADGVDYLDYYTIAYETASGEPQWDARQRGGALGFDVAKSVAVDPNGRAVVVTGALTNVETTSYGFGTVAYDP